MKTPFRDHLGYPALLLGSVILLMSLGLAVGYHLTKEPIQQALDRNMRETFSRVLPPALHDNDLLTSQGRIDAPWGELTFYQAQLDGEVTAVVFPLAAPGYAGPINLLLAILADGTLSGVRVISHVETPGLGDKIEEARDPWITLFSGKSLQNPTPDLWAVKKDGGVFDQFTGATITPRVIVIRIREGLEFFTANRDQFLSPLATGDTP